MFSRRRVLAGIAATTVLGPARAFASGQCAAIDQSTRQCTVGLELGNTETVRQRCNSWCWAACIQTIFALHGHGVAQESAVRKVFGDENICEGANEDEIIAAINGSWVDQYGSQFYARAERLSLASTGIRTSVPDLANPDPANIAADMITNMFSSDDLRVMIGELANNNPLIIGTLGPDIGHAMVLTAVSYREDVNGIVALTELIVRDPWPDSPNRRSLGPDEIHRVFPLIKVTVQG